MARYDTNCPTVNELKGLVSGRPTEIEDADLMPHIDRCPACQKKLDELGALSWAELPRRPASPSSDFGPAYLRAFQRLYGLGQHHAEPVASATPSLVAALLEPTTQPGSLGRLGPYNILSIVGQGGMGIVLRACDTTLGREVAIKILAPGLAHEGAARERFAREARTVAAINHDNVLSIYAVSDSGGLPYLVMPYIAGRSLAEKIEREGRLAPLAILRTGLQTALGLAAAHERGVVHRDIKPSNLLLEGLEERVKIADFGLATPLDSPQLTHSGTLRGTPEFMSPEQAHGDAVDPRSDLFSLGVLLYTMATGQSPFRSSTLLGTLRRVCDETPPRVTQCNPEATAWLAATIERLLQKNPADRYPSAAEVAESLRHQLTFWSPVRRPAPIHEEQAPASPSQSDRQAEASADPILTAPETGIGQSSLRVWTRPLAIAAACVILAIVSWPPHVSHGTTSREPIAHATSHIQRHVAHAHHRALASQTFHRDAGR
jgi:serine/threonine-protein kinase